MKGSRIVGHGEWLRVKGEPRTVNSELITRSN